MNIQYIKAVKEDKERVTALYEQYLDRGEHLRRILSDCFEAESFLGILAVCEGKLAGFYFGCGLLEFSVPHPELSRELLRFMKGESFFVAGGLLVLPEFRGQGIAGQLMERLKQELQEKQICYFLVEIAMTPEGEVPAKKLYERTGKVLFSRSLPGFYREGYRYGVVCALCGTPCKCGACIEVMEVG